MPLGSIIGLTVIHLSRAVDDPAVIKLAEELGQSPGQVILSWVVQRGVVALTKSVTPSRIEQNLRGMSCGTERTR